MSEMARKRGRGRPPANPEGPGVSVTIRMPVELVAKLDELADKQETTRSLLICKAVRQQFVNQRTNKRQRRN
jgi:metal-responsive CopG/Arc/MetJ family transcriptional regulator